MSRRDFRRLVYRGAPRGWEWVPECALAMVRWPIETMRMHQTRRDQAGRMWCLVLVRQHKPGGGS